MFSFRYISHTEEVEVPDNTIGVSLNFTLLRDDPRSWAMEYDFGAVENVEPMHRYLRVNQIYATLQQLENAHPNLVEFISDSNFSPLTLHSLKITEEVCLKCGFLYFNSNIYKCMLLLEVCTKFFACVFFLILKKLCWKCSRQALQVKINYV